MSTADDSKPTFTDWTNRLKVYNDYIKALADYQKSAAEAELKYAEAAGQWEKARLMRVLLLQLQRDFVHLHQATQRNQREIANLQKRERLALALLRGRPIDSWAPTWSAFHWYLERTLLESEDDLYALALPASAHSATDFINQRGRDLPVQPLPADITNVLGLVRWMHEERYLPKLGSEAHRGVVQLVRAINTTVQNAISQMLKAIEEMRKGTFDAWKPPQLLGITETTRRATVEFSPRVPRRRDTNTASKKINRKRAP